MSRKLALVTGGNKGIGYAICKQLLQTQRFNVLLATRSLDNGKKALSALQSDIPDLDPSSISLLELDVSSPSSITASADYVRHELKHSRLDILINNAGIASGDEFNLPLLRSVLATNFHGAIHTTNAFLPMLCPDTDTLSSMQSPGRVLMMSSRVGAISKIGNEQIKEELRDAESLSEDRLNAIMAQFETDLRALDVGEGELSKESVKGKGWWASAYGMSKMALSAYSRILAQRERENGLFVASYCPGFVATDMTAAYGDRVPLGPDDGARGMMMLAEGEEGKYESGRFWCLNKPKDEELSKVDWYNCRIPRVRKEPKVEAK